MKIVFAVLCFTFTSLTPLIGAEYFVNSISGKDSNPGTSSSAPWKSLAPVETKKLQPGDIVNFARGSSWSKSAWETVFLIDDNGAKEKPITFRAYGEGDLPTFSNGGQVWNKGIKITASYVIIENLKVINTGYCGFEISKNANNNIIRKCEVENCGMGILCYGTRNLFTENYIHDLKMIVDNEIPDTQSGGADFGCVAFWLYGPNNEISYNKVYKSRGHSYDYQFDGGFIEFYENCDSTYAHHNWSDIGNGIAEGSNGHGNNITIAYNVFIEHSGLFAIHSNFSITGMIIRNNIFVLGGKSSERVATTNNFTHTNNIYHLLNGAKLGSAVLSEREKLADPLFVDIENKDFRLQAGSPAIDSGKDLGYKIDFSNKTVPFGNAPDIGAFEYDTPTGTSLLELKNDEKFFSLWPNPATNNFNLQVNSNSGVNLNLKIVNLLGQTVHSENHNSFGENSGIIPVSINLSPGVYMVMLSNGFTHATDTLIVQ